jgi:ribonuclease BN (tRNA processing enzyme)
VEITVLGKSPSWPDRDGACSGYLIRSPQRTVLLDCGTGVFAQLRAACPYTEVEAVVLSHLHPDHIMDLVPFASALAYSTVPHDTRPMIYGPPGTAAKLSGLMTVISGSDAEFRRVFDVREYDPARGLELGGLTARFCEVPHFVTTFAVQFSEGDRRFTFGADCGPNPALPEFARDCDLLALEATMGPGPATIEGFRGHLTAREAGELAHAAHVRRLLITHFSDELDAAAIQREASDAYGAEAELAIPGLTLSV